MYNDNGALAGHPEKRMECKPPKSLNSLKHPLKQTQGRRKEAIHPSVLCCKTKAGAMYTSNRQICVLFSLEGK